MVITDFPMTLECRIKEKYDESETGYYLIAKIVNILVDEKYLAEDWRKRSIPTHSGWLYPLTFDAGKGLKEA